MNIIIRSLSAFALSTFMSAVVTTQTTLAATEQEQNQQSICSNNNVEGLLPPPSNPKSDSLSYLAQQGFVQNQDGAWVCYVNDNQKPEQYYTLFKVQQINGALIATSFLNQGNLIPGQGDRSLDLFITLIQNHIGVTPGNQQSIQRYLTSFISLVEQGKIQPSPRGYLFDQPRGGFVLYHSVTGSLQGAGITININSPQNLVSSPAS